MPYQSLILSLEGKVATLTVNRPQVRNALDAASVAEFHRALDEVRSARAGVLIVTGAGDKAFVSGADIRSIRERRRDDALASINSRLMAAVESQEAVSIAAVNGYALGGGCELALACDLRIAADEAKLGLPEAKLGLIPGAGGTQRLTWLCGKGVASRLILGGEVLGGQEALKLGLVQWSVPRDQIADEAAKLAERIASLSVGSVTEAKRLIAAASDPTRDGFAEELEADRRLFDLPDTRARIAHFLAGGR